MEGFNVKEIESIHEQYSLNINNLIMDFEENPEDYQMFVHKNESKTQTIMISKNGKEVLFMEFSNSFVTISEAKSGLEYRINYSSNEVIEIGEEKIRECEIYETFDSSKEFKLDVILGITEEDEITCIVSGGELNWPINDGKDLMSAIFGIKKEPRDEEIEDDDSKFMNEEELDTESVEKEFELVSQENFEYDDDEDYEEDDDDIDEQDELNDEDEEAVILFDFWKNGEKYQQIPDDEFDEIVSCTKDISNQIVNDLQIRMEELTLLRKRISNMLKLYNKTQREEK